MRTSCCHINPPKANSEGRNEDKNFINGILCAGFYRNKNEGADVYEKNYRIGFASAVVYERCLFCCVASLVLPKLREQAGVQDTPGWGQPAG